LDVVADLCELDVGVWDGVWDGVSTAGWRAISEAGCCVVVDVVAVEICDDRRVGMDVGTTGGAISLLASLLALSISIMHCIHLGTFVLLLALFHLSCGRMNVVK
jgi:hypothetical protein